MQSRRYQITNEVLNSVTHGIGLILSIIGFVFLMLKAFEDGRQLEWTAFIIYGCSLLILYTCSMLFHGLYFTKAREVFRIFDHSGVYILIAGTYTPYSLLAIKGWLGWTILLTIWALAITGITANAVWPGKLRKIETVIYVLMGWMCLAGGRQLWLNLGVTGFWLLVAGGVAFTLGALLYSLPHVKYIHVIWHIFVMIGTTLMYFSIYFYI
ncbi:PAQR family membrane homeostasis protein TrhA [Lactiplantibacillus pingfangensis]|uniref:PAQR family membrane homeostasis protein TrhA n=1 Tax=Lactiplantibacillus pingfangensis TaxID=2559915 RepID=UPI0010F69B40|nr:hemolysin III family protein [Lactiplantibacillus pingfangensis]